MPATRPSATLLDADPSILTRRLLLQDDEPGAYQHEELTELLPQPAPHAVTITPRPGVCVKTRLSGSGEAGAKVFVNLCTSDAVPPPDDVTDQELIEVLESEDPSKFRIPLSIGEAHEETDKSGKPCTAYDVVVNPTFLEKSKYNSVFHNVLIVATLESLELKYSLELDKNGWTVLKNKLYLGTAREQCVRTVMPLVQEVSTLRPAAPPSGPARGTSNTTDDSKTSGFDVVKKHGDAASGFLGDDNKAAATNKNKHDRLMTPVSSTKKTKEESAKRRPECVLRRVMGEGSDGAQAEMVAVTARVELPGVSSSRDVSVLVGEDRVVLESSVHFLDVLLPCTVEADTATAHFVLDKQTMVITAPVRAR